MVTAPINLPNLVALIGTNLREHRAWLMQETKIHDAIEQSLVRSGIAYKREYHLTAKDRLDFWLVDHAIAVEVKKQKATLADLRQVGRYLEDDRIAGCIVIAPRADEQVKSLQGKPISFLTFWKFLL
jgi:RecB family endonuclease NucS